MTSDQPEPADPHAALPASDHDRDRVAETLSKAFSAERLEPEDYRQRLDGVFRARTFGELERLTVDLPGHLPARALAGAAPGAAGQPAVVAVFGSVERHGRWLLPERLVATAVFGRVRLDLSEAVLAAPETELVLTAVLGTVELVVPDGLRVFDAGAVVFGTRQVDVSAAGHPGTTEDPLLRLSGVALLGRVSVVRSGTPRQAPEP